MAGAEPLIVGVRAEGPRRNAFVSKQVGTMSIEHSAHTIHRSVGSCLAGTFAAAGLALLGANLACAQNQGARRRQSGTAPCARREDDSWGPTRCRDPIWEERAD